jgi:Universal stress protein UspA and related nucleotide-binding proteins
LNTQSEKEGLSVLIPVDFSKGTEDWVRQGLSRLSNVARVRLLYVIPLSISDVSRFIFEDVVEERRKAAERKMRSLVKLVESFGPYEVSYEIAVGDPAKVILERADSKRFDVIIMGHRGYGCLKSLLKGSVTVKVIAKSPIPVLVVRRSPRPSLKAFRRGRLKRRSRARPTSEVLPVGRVN